MSGLRISSDLTLPLEAVTQTFAILAKRGVGKTYTAAVLMEELVKARLHVCVVDPVGVWWGLRSSADGEGPGLPVVILGGDHADVPLEVGAGRMVADGSRCGFKPSAEYRASHTEHNPKPKAESESQSDDEEEDMAPTKTVDEGLSEADRAARVSITAGGETVDTTLGGLVDLNERLAADRETGEIDEKAEKARKRRETRTKTPAFNCPLGFWPRGFPSENYPVPSEDTFKDDDGADLDFIPAFDIEHIAGYLREKYAAEFGHLKNFKIGFKWRRQGGKRQGKAVFGRCQKTAGLLREYSGADFIIMISGDHCRTGRITNRQMEALVFHELLHADATADYRPRVHPHDFEGFLAELREYGPWYKTLQEAAGILTQPSLFDEPLATGANDAQS